MSPAREASSSWRKPVGFAEVPDFHVGVARQVDRRADPERADRPLIVGGDPDKRGKVLALSAELRRLGLSEGMPMQEALERAPGTPWRRTDMARAREVSGQLRAAVRREVEAVETEGLAAFYLEAPSDRAEALDLGRRLVASVQRATGLSLRCGVAPAGFAARWAAEDAGEGGIGVIVREDFESYLLRQPIERLPGVGPRTAARLAELGALDIPALRALGEDRLETLLGQHGRRLWQLAWGGDPRPLRVKRHPSTLSRETALARPQPDPSGLVACLGRLAESLESALRRDGLRAGRIALRITDEHARTVTRSRVLEAPVVEAPSLMQAARTLLERTEIPPPAVRKLGLVLAGLELAGADDRQLELF